MFGLDFSGTRANSCKHKRSSRLMRLELSCARFILVEVSLHEKNSSGSSGGFGALRRTTGSCRGRLWNPVAIPIPCLDSFRPLRPRKPWQLRPAGSGSTPARTPFRIGLPSSTQPEMGEERLSQKKKVHVSSKHERLIVGDKDQFLTEKNCPRRNQAKAPPKKIGNARRA